MSEFNTIRFASAYLRSRLAACRADENGYSTEAVIVTTLLVVMAIVAVGIISVKVIGAANNLQTS